MRAGRLLALGAALLSCGATWAAARAAGPEDVEHLTLVGRVFMEPVDARRIVVAISTRMDGASEHLFLYTASAPLTAPPRMRNVVATLYYETTGGLRITPANGEKIFEFILSPAFDSRRPDSSVIPFRQTHGLRHYLANPRLRPGELSAMRKTGNCDLAPEHCVEVAGQYLPFTG